MASPSVITEENAKTIDAVKVLLLILVVYIHQLPGDYAPIGNNLSWEMIYRLFSETISHNIGRIAVPGFFVFSGYFFFLRMGDNFSANWLKKQWKKRVTSLLLPYIFWNVAFICIIYAKNKFLIGNSTDDHYTLSKQLGFYGVMWSYPINIPLWYIRDLMCMVAISPLLFWLCKYTQWYGILALYLLFVMNVETTVPGFSSTAIFYFSVGTLLAVKKENIISFADKNRVLFKFIATILLILSVSYNGSKIHEYLVRLFIPFGIFSFINITSSLKQSIIITINSNQQLNCCD